MAGYTVYNHMLLPTFFESPEANYHHLKKHVQVWGVACERQVEDSLLSYSNNMTRAPHECGLAQFCDTQTAIGRNALLRVAKDGPIRQVHPIKIEGHFRERRYTSAQPCSVFCAHPLARRVLH